MWTFDEVILNYCFIDKKFMVHLKLPLAHFEQENSRKKNHALRIDYMKNWDWHMRLV